MKMIYIYCEGQTEESFINEVLYPYFLNLNIIVTPIICTTKRTAKQKFKGGVSDYFKIQNELTIICKQHKNEMVTTMFDYYAMPTNTPNIGCDEPDLYTRLNMIEEAIEYDIGMRNMFFGLNLHEFEGLLFSEPNAFLEITTPEVVAEIQRMRDEAETPEHVNNSPLTAPSKRLESLMPNYAKVKNGTIVSKNIGIDKMMQECKHFKSWINRIKEC